MMTKIDLEQFLAVRNAGGRELIPERPRYTGTMASPRPLWDLSSFSGGGVHFTHVFCSRPKKRPLGVIL